MLNYLFLAQQAAVVDINFRLNGIVALIAGILILLIPRLLNYIIAFYLILIGLVQVFNVRI
ncbi:DUF3096 domain-containing protein [Kovacikia minuta CCNUW1]|uniref:DUF3096 domain-containing protein n=1 Tax=Kovacikia minuta TaxID=2931930 RepID=UPI001CCF645F|nr:DUF3096 domain-containing protein [Kovacikia minuta]UBF25592.1 DUF3096 domain-containing protein [Kovacikia minuta CCNUW1]